MAGKKLLVADDSLTIQKVIRLALSNEGYEIQAISDGADAIQHISTFRPDAILIDVSLPTRSAFEIKREINKMGDLASIRFVLMSSAFEKIDEAQAEEVGFDGNLTKPFDPAHLRQILTDVLAAPPSMPSVSKPELSSGGIQLDPPTDFPPSDFEMIEPTRVQLQIPPAREPTHKATGEPVREPILESDELWGKHEELPPAPPPRISPPAPPSEPHSEPQSEHDEIRELTESTIRMSGLAEMSEIEKADFEWKVNEPSLKPPSSLADTGESSFQMVPPSHPRESEPAAPDFADIPPPLPVSEMAEIPDFPDSGSIDSTPSGAPSGTSSKIPGGTAGKIEDEVRRQVQETLQSTLEKMARQILPEVAERVIKAEISRLLNEKI